MYERRKSAIVFLFPRYNPDLEAQLPDYCRAKLILYHPFRDSSLAALRTVDDVDSDTWEEAFHYCQENHRHDNDSLGEKSLLDGGNVEDDGLESEASNVEDTRVQGPDKIITGRGPNRDGIDIPILSDLGERPEDKDHDWLNDNGGYDTASVDANIVQANDEA